MTELHQLKIDDAPVHPNSVRCYEELLKVELLLDEVDKVFPYKPETPRYKVSARLKANQQTSVLSLHRQ